jgi:hypothetical protein
MTDKITLSKESLAELMKAAATEAVAAMMPAKKAKGTKGRPGPKPKTEEEKAKAREDINKETIAAFAKAGIEGVTPRVDVLVYDKWIEQGRRVKKGAKAVKVRSFALFHVSQTEAIASDRTGTMH